MDMGDGVLEQEGDLVVSLIIQAETQIEGAVDRPA